VIDHPCPFPEEIPDRLIKLYSYKDDIVLDPFAGSGQTLKVAKQLDRQYVGYETIAKYAQLARKRITGKSAIRPQQLIARFYKIGKDDPAGQSS
jgi:site-specific DNA-methyltransferase (adenine-specific)